MFEVFAITMTKELIEGKKGNEDIILFFFADDMALYLVEFQTL